MNMAGIQHPLDEDVTVLSVDTAQVIPFNLETMKDNPSTLRELKEKGYAYNKLIKLTIDDSHHMT